MTFKKTQVETAEIIQALRSLIAEQARPLGMPYLKAAGDASGHNFSSAKLDSLGYYAVVDSDREDCTELVLDPQQDFITRCNLGTVELERVEAPDDVAELLELIELHQKYTGSTIADKVLQQWPEILSQFVKVMPTDYKRVLAERARHDGEMEAGVHGVAGA